MALVIQHAKRMRRITLSSLSSPALQNVSTLGYLKRYDFRKDFIEYKICVLIFCITFD